MKNLIAVCICILVLVSCNEADRVYEIGRKVVSSVPEEVVALTAIDSVGGNNLEAAGGLACVVDSIVIIKLISQTQNCFRALNYSTKESVDFLHKGRGPNEVVAGFFSGVRRVDGQVLLDVTAINEGVLLTIDLGQTLQDGRIVIPERRTLLRNSSFSYPFGDAILSEVLYDEDQVSYKFYNWRDQKVTRTVQPFGAGDYVTQYEPLLNCARRIRPDGRKICLGMFYFDEINIFDIFGEDHLSVSTSRNVNDAAIINKAIESDIWGEEIYYITVAVTNDIILALYSDGSDQDSRWASSTIHAFSWDGQLKTIYHLDNPVTSIAVCEDGKTLYGLTADEVLYRYDLSQ